ncbi:uncharacterized protein LOC128106688 [Peromyscus californicus insignis]|uniref:uncharacterized protein LOC128106688 n=1 Tax=Peromyscus californicus insignis TaxID=564181 RepID=UPI0022A6A35A|nr:uncharacterized protein LOC128106688 [Peromyscus californicus insignis]
MFPCDHPLVRSTVSALGHPRFLNVAALGLALRPGVDIPPSRVDGTPFVLRGGRTGLDRAADPAVQLPARPGGRAGLQTPTGVCRRRIGEGGFHGPTSSLALEEGALEHLSTWCRPQRRRLSLSSSSPCRSEGARVGGGKESAAKESRRRGRGGGGEATQVNSFAAPARRGEEKRWEGATARSPAGQRAPEGPGCALGGPGIRTPPEPCRRPRSGCSPPVGLEEPRGHRQLFALTEGRRGKRLNAPPEGKPKRKGRKEALTRTSAARVALYCLPSRKWTFRYFLSLLAPLLGQTEPFGPALLEKPTPKKASEESTVEKFCTATRHGALLCTLESRVLSGTGVPGAQTPARRGGRPALAA